MTKVERNVEKLKIAQAKRGVIPSLRGLDSPKGSKPLRAKLRDDLRAARKLTWLAEQPINRSGEKPTFKAEPYGGLGGHYAEGTGVLTYFARFKLPSFHAAVKELLTNSQESGEKVRWLDIGPGVAKNFMPYFEAQDPENKLIELHTLSPDQILPRVKRADAAGNAVVSNPEYVRWKDRLTHHVGAVETVNPTRLGGKFHLIVSAFGGTYFNVDPHETYLKVADLLAPGGKAFLHFNGNRRLDIDDTSTQFDRNFDVKHFFHPYGNFVVITRKR